MWWIDDGALVDPEGDPRLTVVKGPHERHGGSVVDVPQPAKHASGHLPDALLVPGGYDDVAVFKGGPEQLGDQVTS